LARLGRQVYSLQSSWIPDAMAFLIGLIISTQKIYVRLPHEVLHWKIAELPLFEIAQVWNSWISLPLFYFFFFRWLWRFLIWTYFLLRIALYFPDLKSLHPDHVGGFGFILRLQKMFGIPLFAVSSVASANIAMVLLYGNGTLDDFYNPILFYAASINILMMLPLISFTPSLIVARNQGLIRYSGLANQYASEFDQKWLRGKPLAVEVVGTPDIQSLNDLHGSYSSQAKMRIVLFDFRTVAAITFSATTPLLPLLLFKFPVVQLLTMVAKYFFKL
jgi:hypothetical protein